MTLMSGSRARPRVLVAAIALLTCAVLGTSLIPGPASSAATDPDPVAGQRVAAPKVRFLSYNIKGGNGVDFPTWAQRYAGSNGIKNVLDDANADVMAIQEIEVAPGIDYSNNSLNVDYVSTGVYGRHGSQTTKLYWKSARFALVPGPLASYERDIFPTNPACQSAGGRYAVALTLSDYSTVYDYFIVAVHLTGNGATCNAEREAQVTAVRDMIAKRPAGSIPVVLGDFNSATPACSSAADGKSISDMLAPGGLAGFNLKVVGSASLPCTSTYATFNKNWDSSTSNDVKRIDYVFYNNTLSEVASSVDRRMKTIDGVVKSPSDHYAIWATLTP